jgi:hypothetical protein
MSKVSELKRHLKRGSVYRRDDLTKWSTSVDRHLAQLVQEGTLEKLSQGLYYYPQKTAFGNTPPEEKKLLNSFLKDSRFLVTSPNLYNSLGLGTTQLYNRRVVYNSKRHGEIKLGNRTFDFQIKPHFPSKVTPEFLLVDLVNNIDHLAEDRDIVLQQVVSKIKEMKSVKFGSTLEKYGTAKTKKLLGLLIESLHLEHA